MIRLGVHCVNWFGDRKCNGLPVLEFDRAVAQKHSGTSSISNVPQINYCLLKKKRDQHATSVR